MSKCNEGCLCKRHKTRRARSNICCLCEKTVYAKGWCASHYRRDRIYGDPQHAVPIGKQRGPGLQWLIEQAGYADNECLTWPFARDSNGYAGGISNPDSGKRVSSHAFMCELQNGPRPEGNYEASHTCGKGNLGCVSPQHLIWETQTDNNLRKKLHGTDRRGERCPTAKLTEVQVIDIKSRLRSGETHSSIAYDVGVGRKAITKIAGGHRWGHVMLDVAA